MSNNRYNITLSDRDNRKRLALAVGATERERQKIERRHALHERQVARQRFRFTVVKSQLFATFYATQNAELDVANQWVHQQLEPQLEAALNQSSFPYWVSRRADIRHFFKPLELIIQKC